MYYLADKLIDGNEDIFSDETYESATLYLSKSGITLSSTTSPWQYFNSIKEYDPAGIEDVVADFNADEPYEVYNILGVKVADTTDGLAPGIYIIRQGKVVKKIIVK